MFEQVMQFQVVLEKTLHGEGGGIPQPPPLLTFDQALVLFPRNFVTPGR
jgi:hypothetical protein